jgi:hypothetical protein
MVGVVYWFVYLRKNIQEPKTSENVSHAVVD